MFANGWSKKRFNAFLDSVVCCLFNCVLYLKVINYENVRRKESRVTS